MKRVFQFVPAGSSIIATTLNRLVKMDLKKIMAFVMLALMVIPSVRADTTIEETAVGLRCAIDRAYLFIGKIDAAVVRLGEEDYDVQDIVANLSEAVDHLEDAEAFLDPLDVARARAFQVIPFSVQSS